MVQGYNGLSLLASSAIAGCHQAETLVL